MPGHSFPPLPQHLRAWLIAFTAILLVGAGMGYNVYREHQLAGEVAADRMHVQMRVVEENLNAQLAAASRALAGVIRDIPDWEREKNPNGAYRRLAALSEAIPGVRTVFILDKDGKVLQSNRAVLNGLNFGARDYFQVPRRDNNADKLYVAPPIYGYTGVYILNLSRVIQGPNGEFDGMVVASLDIKYFTTLLSSVLHAPDMWSAIAHADGQLFATVPTQDQLAGVNLGGGDGVVGRHQAGGGMESLIDANVAGHERLICLRTIQPPELQMNRGLVVMISRDPDVIYAHWRQNTLLLGSIYFSFCLLLTGGLYFYQRVQRSSEVESLAAGRALRESNERLRLATRAANMGIWEYDVVRDRLTWDEGMFAIFGVAESDFDYTLQAWSRMVLPEDYPAIEAEFAHAIETGTPLNARFRIRRGDGSVRSLRALADVFRDPSGDTIKVVGINEDITARQQAKAALREAEQRFRLAFDNAAIGKALVSPDGHFLEANRALIDILGYREHELQAMTFQQLTHPDDLNVDLELLQELVRGQRSTYRMEKRYIKKNGDLVWAELSVSAMRGDDGNVQYFISQIQDVTARKTVDELVRRERDLFAGGPAMVMVTEVGARWQVGYVSANARSILGYAPAEIIAPGFDFNEHIHPDDRPRIETALQSLATTDLPSLELSYRFRTRDGHYRWFYDYNVAERDGGGRLLRIRCYILDQSGIKATEEALQNTNLILSDVLGSATETIIIGTDPDGVITIFNRGAEAMLGYRADEMIGVVTPMMLHKPSELARRARQLSGEFGRAIRDFEIFTCRTETEGGEQHDWTLVKKDGSELAVSLIVTALRSSSGGILGYLCIGRDVTEARAYETGLREAKRQAEEASVAKSQFVANMSHEIRTPMNAILGMVQLLEHTEMSPLQADYVSKTHGAAESLLGVLNDILDFSKVESGKLELERRPFDVDQFLRDLAVILSATAGQKDVEILFSVDPRLPKRLVGDSLRLQQVLINLGGNAVKFTDRGEVMISLHATHISETHVDIEFSTRDTGIGIAPENLERIFEGFTQAEASTTRRFGGTGLGLAISQRLIRLMGGELQVESEPGIGSTFYFGLRLARDAAEHAAALDSNVLGLRVLIVDDNESSRDMLAEMSNTLGWLPATLASGEAVLAELAAKGGLPYDVIFMDWHMPGLDGWEVSRLLQEWHHQHAAEPDHRMPVIVMITAHDRELLARRMNESSEVVDGFLVKPITSNMMLDAVSDVLSSLSGSAVPSPAPAPMPRRLDGLRLLVVEDNRMNQKVAMELLRGEGAAVEVAGGGEAGVAMAMAEPGFDAVLMDIQMPDMDGYAATREIRRRQAEARVGRRLPILAMTANVLPSDRVASREAGMDAHIAKPIDLDAMVAVIRAVCRPDAQPIQLPPRPAAHNGGAALLATERAIARLGGNEALFGRMAASFSSDAHALCQRVREALAGHDAPDDFARAELRRQLHTLKGIAGGVGAERLANYAHNAEERVEERDFDSLAGRSLVKELERLVRQTCAVLHPWLEHKPAASLENADAAMSLSALVGRLEDQLASQSMRAGATLASLQQRQDKTLAAHLPALADAVNRLDFKLALRHCQHLKQAIS